MKSDRCFVLLAATMLATAATTVLTACTDDDDVIIPVVQSFNYKTTMFGSSDSQRILLDSLTADITDVVSNDSWLKVTAGFNIIDHAVEPMQQSVIVVRQLVQFLLTISGQFSQQNG
jgi:hypothetical protein